jgi:hypothetical protein
MPLGLKGRWVVKNQLRILSFPPFGLRLSEALWKRALSLDPDVIVGQATSSDGGPNYLGVDTAFAGLLSIRDDLRKILVASKERNIPFIFSTGSPSGSNAALSYSLRMIDEIASEKGLNIRAAVIPGEIGKEYLRKRIREGTPVKRMKEASTLSEFLTEKEVDETHRIVAQMGPEPMMEGFRLGVEGVICGRSLDIGLFMAPALRRGFDKGLAAHLGKCLECGGLVTVPQALAPVFGVLHEDHFTVHPVVENSRVTCESIIAHTLYERANPYQEANPGGLLDISKARYEQQDEWSVRVSGSRWIEQPYQLKLEGVRLQGYRTISISGIREERMIKTLGEFLEKAKRHLAERFRGEHERNYHLLFRRYGLDGVLGEGEPLRQSLPHEIGLIIDVVARTQDLADAVCSSAVDFVLHMDYPGRLTTAGNIAIPFSPREIPMGPVYTFNIWHLLPLKDPCEPFHITVCQFPRETSGLCVQADRGESL